MTPLKKLNSLFKEYRSELVSEPYLKINLILAGVIVLVLAYSGIFSPDRNNYPVVCIHEKITGLKCFSCGLSHSFSLIIRGRIDEAFTWNVYGMQVFLFFLFQLILRASFSIFFITAKENRKQLILLDVVGSIIIFLLVFYPFFRQLLLELIYSPK